MWSDDGRDVDKSGDSGCFQTSNGLESATPSRDAGRKPATPWDAAEIVTASHWTHPSRCLHSMLWSPNLGSS